MERCSSNHALLARSLLAVAVCLLVASVGAAPQGGFSDRKTRATSIRSLEGAAVDLGLHRSLLTGPTYNYGGEKLYYPHPGTYSYGDDDGKDGDDDGVYGDDDGKYGDDDGLYGDDDGLYGDDDGVYGDDDGEYGDDDGKYGDDDGHDDDDGDEGDDDGHYGSYIPYAHDPIPYYGNVP